MTKGIHIKPSKEELENYIYNLKLKPREIADRLGYANGEGNIYRYCREYGLKFDFRKNSHLRKLNFSDKQKSFIIGTLLGDAYLRPSGSTYALTFCHSYKQVDYLEWKKEILNPFVIADSASSREHEAFGSKTTLLSYNTVVHPYFKELRPLLYVDGRKALLPEILSLVDDFALAVWFMDDGSQNKKYGTMSISTNGFSYEEHLLLQEWFLEKWNIPVKIEKQKQRSGKITYSTRINRSVAPQLVEIIKPHIIESMKYKISSFLY